MAVCSLTLATMKCVEIQVLMRRNRVFSPPRGHPVNAVYLNTCCFVLSHREKKCTVCGQNEEIFCVTVDDT